MTVNLSALAGAGQQFFSNSGVPLNGGKLYSYAAGTTTPQTCYTSASGATPHTNPIILDSSGRVATGEIWLTAGNNYKFVLYDSTDVLIATWDNITGINGTGITSNASNVQYDPAGTGAVSTTVQAKLRQTVSVKDFGAVGNGIADDTAAIQVAVTASINGKLIFPPGEYKITSGISIAGRITIEGSGVRQTLITCTACSGFTIAAGTGFVTMTDLTISASVRYTTTPNAFTGISINGVTANQCYWHTYRNVFVDGFQVAFYAGSVGSTVFDNCTGTYSQGGLVFTGQCLNNTVIASRFGEQDSGSKTPSSGSYGIKIGDTTGSTEGLQITDCLIFGVARGIWGNGCINVYAANNILDMCKDFGFLMQSNATYPCINNIIDGNYVAFNYAGGSTGIYLVNALPAYDSQNRGTNVINNEILAYAGGAATVDYGILIDGAAEDRNLISGNRIQNTTVFDCRIVTGTRHRISDNIWRSTNGFSTAQPVAYINNVGNVSSASYPSPVGLFTPTIVGTTTAGVGTYSVQEGRYKIIDNILYFNLRVIWSAHTGTGLMKVGGLPVASVLSANYFPAVTVNAENITFPAGATAIIGAVNSGLTLIELRGAGDGLAPTPVNMDTSGNLSISGFYYLS